MYQSSSENQWKMLYKAGAVSVYSAMVIMVIEILLTALPEGARVYHNIGELLEMYNRHWFMAMRYMGLMNIFATTLMIPVFFALFGLHREKILVFSGLALILHIV
jgi:hypothetical protein